MRMTVRRWLLAAAAAALAGGCVWPPVREGDLGGSTLPAPPPGAFMCPAEASRTTQQTIPESGGTLTLAGHELRIPAGHPDTYRLTEPKSEYVMVEAGPDKTFRTGSTAQLTISYARCGNRPIPSPPYRILRYEPTSGRWEAVRGEVVTSPDGRSISAPLPSLSGYAIAGG
jgi:hypothetical protein